MKDKIAWVILSEKNKSKKKMAQLAKDFEKKKDSVDLLSEEASAIMTHLEKAKARGMDFITYMDPSYPDSLRNIASPPPYLYVRGDKSLLKYPVKVCMVGSRECSLYGINAASNFAFELASNDVCIVSGGAKGIDAASMRGALRAKGKVIAVIGTGINIDYPPENEELFASVAETGVIISEFPWGMGPLGYNFPRRNRIMTALGDATVIVEAGVKSGALISASHAEEQGKTLFAVPGNIDSPTSVGTNNLLRDGAMFATSGSDILFYLMENMPDEYRMAKNFQKEDEGENVFREIKREEMKKEEKALSCDERAVVNAIKAGNNTYDDIREFCSVETNKLTSLLTIMEIKGIIKFAFGNRYKIND